MVAVKTNERPGTRAQVRYARMSATKAREVLDLIRGRHVVEADQILQFSERDASLVIRKCLASAVANAAGNDEQDPETLQVVACYADEGPTLKRWRPRARGRATRIRKRTCHITVIVARMPEDELRRWNERHARPTTAAARGRRRGGGAAADRRARVARSRARDQEATATEVAETEVEGVEESEAAGAAGAEAELAEQDAAAEQDAVEEVEAEDAEEVEDVDEVEAEDAEVAEDGEETDEKDEG